MPLTQEIYLRIVVTYRESRSLQLDSEVKFKFKEFKMSKGSNSGKSSSSGSRATPPGSGGWPSTVPGGKSGGGKYNAPPSNK